MVKYVFRFLIVFLVVLTALKSFAIDYYEIGRQAYANERYYNAKLSFEKALSTDPGNPRYRYFYAHSLLKLGDVKEAALQYNNILALYPDTDIAKLAMQSLSYINQYYKNAEKSTATKPLKPADLNLFADNYIENAFNPSGEITKWESMPISVYVEHGSYQDVVKKAFQAWQSACGSVLRFNMVSSPSAADIKVSFAESLEKTNTGENYLAGISKPILKGNNFYKSEILLLVKDPDTRQPLPETSVYSTAMHEIGHSIGIRGHSPNSADLMSASVEENNQLTSLSKRDINTVNMLYRLDSTQIASSNVKNSKLKEVQDYVKKFPEKAIGWSNQGDVYLGMKQYDSAILSYRKAVSIEPNNPEYNGLLASAYAAKGDYMNSLVFYKKAVELDKNNKYLLYEFAKTSKTAGKSSVSRPYVNNYLRNNPSARSDELLRQIID